jgi:hypothetical protein
VRVVLPHLSPLRRDYRINELHATKYEYNNIENFLLPITFLKHSGHSSLRHYSYTDVTQRTIFRKRRGLSILILISASNINILYGYNYKQSDGTKL